MNIGREEEMEDRGRYYHCFGGAFCSPLGPAASLLETPWFGNGKWENPNQILR